jgi:hypothetical protein
MKEYVNEPHRCRIRPFPLPSHPFWPLHDATPCPSSLGIHIYHRPEISFSADFQSTFTPTFSAVQTQVVACPPSNIYNIIAIYRLPNTPLLPFLDYLSSVLHPDLSTILLGDFNVDITSPTAPKALTTFLREKGFEQLIAHPTTPQGSTLDHIWSTIPATTYIYPTYWTDHAAIIAHVHY